MIFSRMHGQVAFYNLDRHFGKIAGDDGINYLVRGPENISTVDVYDRRFLLDGEHVEFTPHGSAGRNIALAVEANRDPEVHDASYREDAVVTAWDARRNSGFAQRQTGDSLHLNQRDVVTYGLLGEGIEIRCKPEPPGRGFHFWQAKEIQIYIDIEKGDESVCVQNL